MGFIPVLSLRPTADLGGTTAAPGGHGLRHILVWRPLWKYEQDIMKVIGACAAIGLIYTYLA